MSAEVIGVGMRCPLGLSSMMAAMNVRATKFEPFGVSHIKTKAGESVGVCLSGGLSLKLYGYKRLLSLAAPAACEACHEPLAQLSPKGDLLLPVVLNLAEAGRPDNSEAHDAQFFSDLAERTGLPLDPQASIILRKGHAGGAYALEEAFTMLDAGAVAVLVGAVDSYFHPRVLRHLEEEYRLHCPTVDNGFIPSEAAAFLLLTRAKNVPDGCELPARLARIRAVWTGTEETVDAGLPNVAECMTELVELAKADGPLHWVLSDLNGEMHRAREWSLVMVRHQLHSDVQHDPVPRDMGDVGAASALAMLNLVCSMWIAHCAPAQRAAILVHAEGSERGLIVAEAPA